jgi:hypothetical protein
MLGIVLVERDTVACTFGLMLTFQIFAFTPNVYDSSVASSSWALLTGQTPDPPTTQQVDVLVAMKHVKRMILLSVRNIDESSLYSIEVRNPDGAIKFAKARGWDMEKLDPNVVKISTNDRPINRGRNLVLLVLNENFSSSLQWIVYDSFDKILASGTVKESTTQHTGNAVAKEGTEGASKSQPTTHDDTLMLKVVDGTSKRPVEGATVIIINSSGKVLASKTTDSNGEIILLLSHGNYKVVIQADGYNKLVESLELQGYMQKTVELTHSSGITIRTTAITN